MLKSKVKVRFTHRSFSLNNTNYAPGTLLVTRAGNENLKDFDSLVQNGARQYDRLAIPVKTGLVTNGVDFGSNKVSFLKPPKVALLTGEKVSPYNFGAIWHFFEQQIGFEITVINTSYLSSIQLHKYNVIVLPSGYYDDILDKKLMNKLNDWVKSGGKIVAFGGAISIFESSDNFEISKYGSKKLKDIDIKRRDSIKEKSRLLSYELRERNSLSQMVQGSVFKTSLDHTNPLGYGYMSTYYSLKTSSKRYAYLKSGYNVGVIKNKTDKISGFAGSNVLEGIDDSLVYGVERKGKGSIVYLIDDPLFGNFWENGKLLFSNAIFMVGND